MTRKLNKKHLIHSSEGFSDTHVSQAKNPYFETGRVTPRGEPAWSTDQASGQPGLESEILGDAVKGREEEEGLAHLMLSVSS